MHLSKQILALSALALFALIVVFGLHATMVIDKDGNMSNCPFMNGVSSICRMNIMEHIEGWQSTFTTTVPAVIVLLVALVLLLGSHFNFEDNDALAIQRSYKHRNSLSKVFNYLRIAFSRGILHSKVFDPSFLIS